MRFTPFAFVSSQINTPDSKGKESLFEAEMHRYHRDLTVLDELTQYGKPAFLGYDEMFSSTNSIEGIASAQAIVQWLAQKHKNVIGMITTHFTQLTELAQKHTDCIGAYKMDANVNNDHQISFPYVLTKGVSTQHIALDLLKQNGFAENIIEFAIAVKAKLNSV